MDSTSYRALPPSAKLWLLWRFAWTQRKRAPAAWMAFWFFAIVFGSPAISYSLGWKIGLHEGIVIARGSDQERELLRYLTLVDQNREDAHLNKSTSVEQYRDTVKNSSMGSLGLVSPKAWDRWMRQPMPAVFAAEQSALATAASLSKRESSSAPSPAELASLKAQGIDAATTAWKNYQRQLAQNLGPLQSCGYVEGWPATLFWVKKTNFSGVCLAVANQSWMSAWFFGSLFLLMGCCVWALCQSFFKPEQLATFVAWIPKLCAAWQDWRENFGEAQMARREALLLRLSARSLRPKARSGGRNRL